MLKVAVWAHSFGIRLSQIARSLCLTYDLTICIVDLLFSQIWKIIQHTIWRQRECELNIWYICKFCPSIIFITVLVLILSLQLHLTVRYGSELSDKLKCHIQAPDKVFTNVHSSKKQVCWLVLILMKLSTLEILVFYNLQFFNPSLYFFVMFLVWKRWPFFPAELGLAGFSWKVM